MNPSQASQAILIFILVSIWTGLMTLVRTRKNVPLREQRIALALCVAVTAALLAWGVVWNRPQPQPSDLAPIWASARARLHQQDPYDAVGPGRTFDTAFPQIYPMTAIVTVMPLALMPLRWADPIFVGLGFGLFTWAVTTRRIMTPALVALVSLGALMILQTSQWSLLLTGAALVPGFGWLLIAKPTIGLALFAAFPRWKTAIGCASVHPQHPHLAWLDCGVAVDVVERPARVPPITRKVGPMVPWRSSGGGELMRLSSPSHVCSYDGRI
jgi:hypothetical protein